VCFWAPLRAAVTLAGKAFERRERGIHALGLVQAVPE
jgi:hypothetical protein